MLSVVRSMNAQRICQGECSACPPNSGCDFDMTPEPWNASPTRRAVKIGVSGKFLGYKTY